jgi:hypothetical protein
MKINQYGSFGQYIRVWLVLPSKKYKPAAHSDWKGQIFLNVAQEMTIHPQGVAAGRIG